MAKIETLVKDIYRVLDEGAEVSQKDAEAFGASLAKIMTERLAEARDKKQYLRLSNLGTKCDRRLWLSINRPDTVEKLPSNVRMKFLFGDVLEALLLFLARVAGHTVEGEQDTLEINGVKGHRDAILDGVTTDVKSASTYSFKKFYNGLKEKDDSFGYLDQVGSYLEAGQTDDKVLDKTRAAFLVVDKTLGHITVDVHKKTNTDYAALVSQKRDVISSPTLPPRGFADVPDGASGNRKLGIECSYCPVRAACWPGLRTFAYGNGLRHLTKVVREPNVDEIQ